MTGQQYFFIYRKYYIYNVMTTWYNKTQIKKQEDYTMANTSLLQVRVDPEDREKAAAIADSLGTNLSAVVNMLLKQIIITESIPFEIKLSRPADSETATSEGN